MPKFKMPNTLRLQFLINTIVLIIGVIEGSNIGVAISAVVFLILIVALEILEVIHNHNNTFLAVNLVDRIKAQRVG